MNPSFRVTLKTTLPEELKQARDRISRGLPSLLQQVGVYVWSEQRFSFEDKSRGGGGADGKRWAPLKESTERAKFRKGQKKPRKRKDGTRARRARLIGPVPKSQIGVDRGLLRNSSRPGYSGPDGKGGNILNVEGNRVTLEYGRAYAEHFDAKRPLFPTTAPPAWVQGIEAIVSEWIDQQAGGIK